MTHQTTAAAVGNNSSVLQVRNLAIDVVARRVLSDAGFTVAPGDKVGLVGRNGAGKTSLLKVLAGEDDPAAGLVLRRGTLGYVPQNPRPRAESTHTALSHILSGRGLDRAAARLADLHGLIDRDPSMANLQKFSDAEERYRLDGGYSAESDARRIVTGLGLTLRSESYREASDAASSWLACCSRTPTCCSSTSLRIISTGTPSPG